MNRFFAFCIFVVLNLTTAHAAILDDIKDRGFIKVGISLGGMPMGGRDARNNPVGYDYEVAKQLAERLGVELRVTDVYGDARVSLLVSGQLDLIIGNMTVTPARAEVVDFSDPYFKTGLRIIYQKGLNIKSLADLAGKKIVAGRGTSGAIFVEENIPEAELVYSENFAPNGVLLLRQRRVDAGIEDSSMADYFASQIPSLTILPGIFVAGDVAMGVKKGQPEFLAYLNDFIADYIASGEYEKNIKRWWGEDAEIPELAK
ncbi:MAG: transporter substrate-binding domain-containing protein [Alphaproteobacteria bacterium]|nr:transporter substrate-binding domain-containing protein [Alphaproteobacteria bacterium]HPF45918.1 transporter substrate-binding domain-containing protein [Emcibacteraceae bacterium]HRW30918.1 transporter substrate-binding domain-containing protein [Emcibacteraceae bacterium]